ncbi:polar amino acid transport system substrate-binding protein [Duganella sp. CF458]|uniref:transporter substrate-binding domain-containing protein n=1 Tax=Duganella sp. CF458 TaxID=1884368 RepID=UPI0008E5229B|nr:transporter substrate-binding domain-containing protein [Duganella sp. CF458]SFF87767.1 polar amino acid transport system substrate-binding protein [Duganella sp. CF458]
MKVRAALLCALVSAPLRGQDLQLFVIPDTPAHMEAWKTVAAAARRAGVGVQVQALSAERGMVLTNEGKLDGAIGRTMLAASGYGQLVAVPEPVYLYAPTAYSYKNIDVSRGWKSLRGHTLCIRRGYNVTEERTAGVPRQRLDNDASLLRMLKAGGCDVAVMGRSNKEVMALREHDPDLLQLLPPLEEVPLYLFLHRRHAALVPRLAEALKQLKRE